MADFEAAKERYPSTQMGEEGWRNFFDTPRGFAAMGRILGDIYLEMKTQEAREAGVAPRMGRRPRPVEVPLTELFEYVIPAQYGTECFSEVVRGVLRKRGISQRAFSARVPMHNATLSKYLTGRLQPDRQMMEQIAAALKMPPSVFPEWRAIFLGELVTNILASRPELSITHMRNVRLQRRSS